MRYRHASQRYFDYAQTNQRLRVGLVGHWMGDGSGLTLRDRSGYKQNGTLVNSPKWSLGEGGKRNALHFNGTDSVVNFTPTKLPSGNSDRTVSLWVRTTIAGEKYCFSYGDASYNTDFLIGVFNDYIVFTNNGGAVFGTLFVINDNQWHHLLATHDGSLVRVYVDGKFDGSAGFTLNTGLTSGTIGSAILGGGYEWSGPIDDVRVYNRVLSGAEITLLATPSFLPIIQRIRRKMKLTSSATYRFFFGA